MGSNGFRTNRNIKWFTASLLGWCRIFPWCGPSTPVPTHCLFLYWKATDAPRSLLWAVHQIFCSLDSVSPPSLSSVYQSGVLAMTHDQWRIMLWSWKWVEWYSSPSCSCQYTQIMQKAFILKKKYFVGTFNQTLNILKVGILKCTVFKYYCTTLVLLRYSYLECICIVQYLWFNSDVYSTRCFLLPLILFSFSLVALKWSVQFYQYSISAVIWRVYSWWTFLAACDGMQILNCPTFSSKHFTLV